MRKLIVPLSNERPKDLLSRIKSKISIEKDYRKFYFPSHGDINTAKKIMPPEIFKSYFKFSFVRNPWARLVSEYEYIRKVRAHGRHRKVIKMDFATYIKYQSRRFEAHQINMLTDENGIFLMDFTGKLENLNTDWKYVCGRINIPFSPLPHENTSKRVDYKDYYTEEEKALVEKLWKRDIEIFDYRFEE